MWNIPDKVANSGASLAGKHTHGEFNNRSHELEALVTSAGITLTTYPADPNSSTDANEEMLAESVSRLASLGVAGSCSGSANTYTIAALGDVVAPKALFDRMIVVTLPSATNTGASTANVYGLGSKAVRSWDDTALVGGELVSSRPTALLYSSSANSGAGAWLILPWALPLSTVKLAQFSGVSAKTQSIPASTVTVLTDYTATSSNLDDATFSGGILTVGPRTAGLWLMAVKCSAYTPYAATTTQAYVAPNNQYIGNKGFVNTTTGTFSIVVAFIYLSSGQTADSRMYHNAAGSVTNQFVNGDGGTFLGVRLSA